MLAKEPSAPRHQLQETGLSTPLLPVSLEEPELSHAMWHCGKGSLLRNVPLHCWLSPHFIDPSSSFMVNLCPLPHNSS